MKRRQFIALTSSVAAWPLAARGQQSAKLPTIGFMGSGTATAQRQWTAAFVRRLGELGWAEGRTIAIEYRWAEGRSDRLAEIAAEFARLKVDVILTTRHRPARGQARLHRRSPSCSLPRAIRSVRASSRAWRGLVAMSPARPVKQPDTASKRLELLREIIPRSPSVGNLGRCGQPLHHAGRRRD